jgi:hypothetical protein
MATASNEKEAKEASSEIDQLPTLENHVEFEEVIDVANTVANDATLRPPDTGFGAWSFVSKLYFQKCPMFI